MNPSEYLKVRDEQRAIIEAADAVIFNAAAAARECPIPANLRPATPSDIVEGAIIWHKNGDDGDFWNIVEEVLRPDDPFKAYYSEDGCRYGLDEAYVEVVS